uniref:Ig-like domain-containing protein n=1 Tax=Oncorhynchus mykiss TaxID=8022 RepID=A0A8C7WHW8_ONCMY
MTSATSLLFFAIHLACISTGNSSESFVKLECEEEYHGVYGQQSLLECIVNAVQNVTILTVTWKRVGGDAPLLEYHKHANASTLGFKFAEPSWNKNNMNVSLLLTNTKMADKGVYECMVRTDSGDATATVSLSVTAMYKSPTMSSSPENCIKQNTGVTIFCNSTGGHQKGLIWWFDEFGTNCTGSAELVAKKTDDTLFSLSSKLTVLKATYSGSTNYSCTVHNTNGVQEGKASFEIPFVCSAGSKDDFASDSTTQWLAPVGVIGSLVIGLLAALLIFKRRSVQRARRQSTFPLMSHSGHPTDRHHDDEAEGNAILTVCCIYI